MTELLGDTFYLLDCAQVAECPVKNHKPLLVIQLMGFRLSQIHFPRNENSFTKGAWFQLEILSEKQCCATSFSLGQPRWLEHMAAARLSPWCPWVPKSCAQKKILLSLLSWPLREQAEFPFGCHLLILALYKPPTNCLQRQTCAKTGLPQRALLDKLF